MYKSESASSPLFHHPQPKSMESFSSWLTRLAGANGFTSVNSFGKAVGTHLAYQTSHPDVTLPSWGGLPTTAECSLDTVLKTTFFHFAEKFGRSGPDQRIGSFIGNSLATHLRFCPQCLAEHNCYSLPWRFMQLAGCIEHHVYLLDRCPQCRQPVAIFKPPFQIGVCTTCGFNLRNCAVQPMSEETQAKASDIHLDLEFLLSPQPWDAEAIVPALGPHLGVLRMQQGLTIAEAAKRLSYSTDIFKGLESAEPTKRRGQKLSHYVEYAAFLGMTLRHVFTAVADLVEESPLSSKMSRNDRYEQLLLAKVQRAVQQLQEAQSELTLTAIARAADRSVASLTYYPHIREYLDGLTNPAIREARRVEREEELLTSVKGVVAQLRNRGESVTQAPIARELGRTPEGFKQHTRVYGYLLEVTSRQEREEDLLARVYRAEVELEADGKRITPESIGKRVGMSPEGLKKYASILPVMTEFAHNNQLRHRKRPETYMRRILKAERTLRDNRRPVTQKSISDMIRVPTRTLMYHPDIRTYLHKLVIRYHEYNNALRQREREEEIMAALRRAAQKLAHRGVDVTRKNLLREIGVSNRSISRYPIARALLIHLSRQSEQD